ncbi:response regulator [Occallatibacter savannae]|uniref:response regulator n=1 Tax=Occallatibacter savannae TaxID=1002691 RepID=UPI000D68FF8B|nr:response regulator [Occallatibacter savannae]
MLVIVEDEQRDLKTAARVLSRVGRRFKVFDDASRVIQFLDEVRAGFLSKPEAIILDLNLRKGSGQDVLAALRREPELENIPVIVWTGSDDPTQSDICIFLGAREVLLKTENGQELKDAVSRLREPAH